ncbi:hypothetical protein HK405_004090 [Cladochytrium tenue]|nr:hypothetical protein HK405_004090 [Cladochytrium tenue]
MTDPAKPPWPTTASADDLSLLRSVVGLLSSAGNGNADLGGTGYDSSLTAATSSATAIAITNRSAASTSATGDSSEASLLAARRALRAAVAARTDPAANPAAVLDAVTWLFRTYPALSWKERLDVVESSLHSDFSMISLPTRVVEDTQTFYFPPAGPSFVEPISLLAESQNFLSVESGIIPKFASSFQDKDFVAASRVCPEFKGKEEPIGTNVDVFCRLLAKNDRSEALFALEGFSAAAKGNR